MRSGKAFLVGLIMISAVFLQNSHALCESGSIPPDMPVYQAPYVVIPWDEYDGYIPPEYLVPPAERKTPSTPSPDFPVYPPPYVILPGEEDNRYNPPKTGQPSTGNQQPKSSSKGSSSQTGGFVIVNNPYGTQVHLRESASENAKSLGLYYNGVRAQMHGQPSGGWTSVSIGNRYGFMATDLLAINTESSLIESKKPTMVVNNPKASDWLNLRTSPSKHGDVLGQYYNGQKVTVWGEVGSWCHVDVNGTLGFMEGSYLSQHDPVPLPDYTVLPTSPGAPTSAPWNPNPMPTVAPWETPGQQPGTSLRKFEGSRSFPANKFSVNASIVETKQNAFTATIYISLDSGYTVSDRILNFSLYLNGSHVTNVMPEIQEWNPNEYLYLRFSSPFNFDMPIYSAEVIPFWDHSGTTNSSQSVTLQQKN